MFRVDHVFGHTYYLTNFCKLNKLTLASNDTKMIRHILHTFDQNRKNILALLEEHTLEQVNTIPPGFNNNIIWNAGHLLLSQQFLLYHFSDLPMLDFVQEYTPKYGSGTIPDGGAAQSELDLIMDTLDSSTKKVIDDYNSGLFKTYNAYTSEYFGITVQNIEEAIYFNTYHEGFHFGFMSALKTALR